MAPSETLPLLVVAVLLSASGCAAPLSVDELLAGRLRWSTSPPLVGPAPSAEDTYHSVKDPSIVFHEGRWHLFCTVRGVARTHQIEYLTFADWDQVGSAQRRMLTLHPTYFCAPQVFYFAPQGKWYLICQASDEAWDPQYAAAYSTTTDIADPGAWSPLTPLGAKPADGKAGLDFWIICDERKAHLFFTTLDGRMWREETSLADFPHGWSEPVLAIEGDLFEASHTYRLQGLDKYLTVVEAQGGHGWRYFKAYLADRLDGEWTGIADTRDRSFASLANTTPLGERWTDCISHGELIRSGTDQTLSVDPADLRFVFQGVLDRDRHGKPYGEIPWRLGLLTPALLSLMTVTGLADALFEDTHVVRKPKGDHGYRGIMGDFVQLKDGSILLSYTDGDILVVRSTDGGRTWGEPAVLVARPAPPAKGSICHPSFLRLADGNLMLTYIYTTYPVTPYFATNYYRLSADEGQTWTEPFCYTPHPGYVQVHNDRLLTLSTGRIIATAETKAYLPSTEDHSGYVGMTFFSDDGGFSWQPSRNTVDLYGEQRIEVQEADTVELRDGRALMFARTYSGHPVFAYSEDKGETWGPGVLRKDIVMPYAGLPTVRRIPSTGDLLFIWIDERSQDPEKPQVNRRCALATAISSDEGETLTHLNHIARDPLDDFGYQCVEFLADDLVLVGYHARDGIHVARIGVDWFYGK